MIQCDRCAFPFVPDDITMRDEKPVCTRCWHRAEVNRGKEKALDSQAEAFVRREMWNVLQPMKADQYNWLPEWDQAPYPMDGKAR